MNTADTVTYRYAAGLALLFNVLATAALVAAVDASGTIWWPYAPFVGGCNLAGYAVVLGALRHPNGCAPIRLSLGERHA